MIVYDDQLMLDAIKDFNKKARGIVPGSMEYIDLRNKTYKDVQKKSFEKQGSEIDTKVKRDFSSFFILMLVVPEEPNCFEAVHILNYFNFPFNIEEDNIVWP